jgi:hypothetical protein
LSRLIAAHLELELSFLGAVPEDPHVTLAQRNRQAFSSLFPDSEAAAGVVVVADALDAIPAHFVAGPQTLPTFLDALVTVLQAPVRLPGGGVLEDAHASVARTEGVDELIAADGEQGGETSLLQYAGDVAGLWLSLETLPHTLQSLAGNLEALVAVAGRNSTRMPDDDMGELQGNQLLPLLARLLETFRVAAPEQALELEVTGVSVTGQQQCWLQAGHYLKYTFRLPQGALTDTVAALLDEVPAMSRTSGAEGEDICEVLAAAQNSCLSVISSPQAGPRIQVWLPVARNESLAGVAGRRQGEGITTLGKGLH